VIAGAVDHYRVDLQAGVRVRVGGIAWLMWGIWCIGVLRAWFSWGAEGLVSFVLS